MTNSSESSHHTSVINIADVRRVHFIGVGGIGMSALARLFMRDGKWVSGSDRLESDITTTLQKEGLSPFFAFQEAENISDDMELVVYTEAMAYDHPELVAARNKGIPCVNYFEALGLVANQYYLIAVAGSHGKTTVTAMLIDMFEDAGLDPSGIVGSLRARTGSNYREGKSKYMIVEACEYKRDFLTLTPDIYIILNLELEHVDYYKNIVDIQDAFHTLALQVRDGGVIIAPTHNATVAPVLEGVTAKVIDYEKFFDPTCILTIPGIHNQKNAAAARAVASVVGIDDEVACASLAQFRGTWRRFEYKGEVHGAPVYDDYGHHPTEIAATLEGAREKYPDKNILLVFQPHTYSRLAELFGDFVTTLAQADEIILAPIYAAREVNIHAISNEDLRDAIHVYNEQVRVFDSLGEVVTEIQSLADPDTVVLVMGAGDIVKVTKDLFSN